MPLNSLVVGDGQQKSYTTYFSYHSGIADNVLAWKLKRPLILDCLQSTRILKISQILLFSPRRVLMAIKGAMRHAPDYAPNISQSEQLIQEDCV
jgi:hypothetical protein